MLLAFLAALLAVICLFDKDMRIFILFLLAVADHIFVPVVLCKRNLHNKGCYPIEKDSNRKQKQYENPHIFVK